MSDAKARTDTDDGRRDASDTSALWITAAQAWLEAAALRASIPAQDSETHDALTQAARCIAYAVEPLCERLGCSKAPYGSAAKDAQAIVVAELFFSDIKEEPRH